MDDLIKRARELSAAATPGPWNWANWGDDGDPDDVLEANRPAQDDADRRVWGETVSIKIAKDEDHDLSEADRSFLAESRTLLPALADLAESEGRRADEAKASTWALICECTNADLIALNSASPNIQLRRERDAALAELAALKGQVAVTGEVGEIQRKVTGIRALPWESQANALLVDLETLLAIVQRQAGEIEGWRNGQKQICNTAAVALERVSEELGNCEADRDAARAEVDRLKGDLRDARTAELSALNAHESTICRHSESAQRHTSIEAQLVTELTAQTEKLRSEKSSLAAENARLVNEHAAAMSRADVLAEGVRSYRKSIGVTDGWPAISTPQTHKDWEREHGHMVSK